MDHLLLRNEWKGQANIRDLVSELFKLLCVRRLESSTAVTAGCELRLKNL